MRIHSNATTSPKQRQLFRLSSASCRELARKHSVSPTTVSRWRRRLSFVDKSARPNNIRCAFSNEEQALILALREKRLSLDDIVDAVEPLIPNISRSSVYRLFRRNGVAKLSKEPKDVSGKFKDYLPGYLHIDCFYLPRIDAKKRYCYVAVDRATRLVFLHIYESKTKEVAVDFLGRCIKFFPFQIKTILTDNGHEYSNATFKSRCGTWTRQKHPFGVLCVILGIDHRRTRPYTPKTNGLVERLNGLIQEQTTKKHKYSSADEMIEHILKWLIYYNFYRKHRQIGRKTPYQKACDYYQMHPELFIKEPKALTDLLSTTL